MKFFALAVTGITFIEQRRQNFGFQIEQMSGLEDIFKHFCVFIYLTGSFV